MPELPEVEAVRLSLEPFIKSQKIIDTKVFVEKLISGKGTKRKVNSELTKNFINKTKNKKVLSIARRAKNLIIELEEGVILIHLKMTGQLVFVNNKGIQGTSGGHPIRLSTSDLPNKHTGILFSFQDGKLYYNDTRKFGYVIYIDSLDDLYNSNHFDGLGVEPTESNFTYKYFYNGLKESNTTLKKLFLDQKLVVGLGNIYADEVCFEAGVMPTRKTKNIKKNEALNIYNAINRIIPLAISLGGSSVADYLLADGSRGNYAREHKVYKRTGKECWICQKPLLSIKHAGRTTVYCSICQK